MGGGKSVQEVNFDGDGVLIALLFACKSYATHKCSGVFCIWDHTMFTLISGWYTCSK